MSALTDSFGELQRVIAAECTDSGELTATVGNVAEDVPCLPTEIAFDEINAPDGGGTTLEGQRTIAILISEFSDPPTQGMIVTVSDKPSQELEIIRTPEENGGKYVLTLGRLSALD